MKVKNILIFLLFISCNNPDIQTGKINNFGHVNSIQNVKNQEKEVAELFALEEELADISQVMASNNYKSFSKKKKVQFVKEHGELLARTIIQKYVIAFQENQENQKYSVLTNRTQLQIEVATALKLPLNVDESENVIVPQKTKEMMKPIVRNMESKVSKYPLRVAALPYLFISDNGDIIEHSLLRVLNDDGSHFFVSTSGKYFKDFSEWIRENNLPNGTIWYPQDGFLQTTDDGKALVGSEHTLRTSEAVAGVVDGVAMVGGLVIGALGIAALVGSAPAAAVIGSIGWVGFTFMGYFGLREGYKTRRAVAENQRFDLKDPDTRQHAISLGLNVLGFSASTLSHVQNLKHFSSAQVFSNPAYRYATGFIIGVDTLADTVGAIHNTKLLFDKNISTQDRVLALVNIIFFSPRVATAVGTKFRTSDTSANAKYNKYEMDQIKKKVEANAKAEAEASQTKALVFSISLDKIKGYSSDFKDAIIKSLFKHDPDDIKYDIEFARSFLEENSNRGSFEFEEIAAIRTYTKLLYSPINKALRSVDINELKKYKPVIEGISSGLNKLDWLNCVDCIVYRKISISNDNLNDFLGKYIPGQVIREKSFLSTSLDKWQVFEGGVYEGNVRYIIKSKTGKKIDIISDHHFEKEVLFTPDTRFKVIKKYQKDGTHYIEMEQVI